MNEAWAQYGILGLIVVSLAGYILRLENKHARKEKEWQDTLDSAAKEHSQALKEAAKVQADAIKELSVKQADMLNRITDKMDDRQEETNEIISKHISILESIKYLLERR